MNWFMLLRLLLITSSLDLLPVTMPRHTSAFCSPLIAFLSEFKEGHYAALTLLSDRPLPNYKLRELVSCLDAMGRPLNVLNLYEYPLLLIEEMVQIYETFIIYVFDGNITAKFFELEDASTFIINPWMMISWAGNYDLVPKDLESVYELVPHLTVQTKFYHYYVDEEERRGWIAEVYRIFPKGSLKVRPLFTINNSSLKIIDKSYIWARRKDLEGLHFRIGYIGSSSFFSVTPGGTPKGIFYDIYKILKANLNITETFVESVDGLYGADENTGLVGMAKRGEIDFSILDFDITEERIKYVDFTVSIYVDYKIFYTLNFGNTQSWGAFTGVFSNKFWIATLLCSFLFIPFLWLVFKAVDGEPTIEIVNSVATPFRTMGALDTTDKPLKTPGRILVITVCIFGSMIYWVYNAGLTSVLTVDTSTAPINSFSDLLTSNEYQLVIRRGSALEQELKAATVNSSPVLKKVYDRFIKDNPKALVRSLREGKDLLLSGSMSVLLFPKVALRIQYPNLTCLFHKSTGIEFKANIGWLVKKNFSYLPLFNFQLSQYAQAGVLKRFWIKNKGGKLNVCSNEDFKPIENSSIISAYLILSMGIIVALGIFLFEFLHFLLMKKLQQKIYYNDRARMKKPIAKRY
ncbi:glutamate receptor ionotropic, kainate 4-like [Lepeophtheirus salmonis]|uniref:glutamate receptor ionotropic, kainate 4-like n=1 Tax=Lepeophtheirus salmonis TaxID=72036 RepID=UPI001AEA3A3C|nr:glutamate receptor ionotropic, kainate 4-like [Lepeophtheirus salmonis]